VKLSCFERHVQIVTSKYFKYKRGFVSIVCTESPLMVLFVTVIQFP
jgi:hypothetical protein